VDGDERAATADQRSHHAIDELVRDARRFHSSQEYRDLLKFIRGFRDYSPSTPPSYESSRSAQPMSHQAIAG
jgi:hypothetical protein